jgi:hypothetical protein
MFWFSAALSAAGILEPAICSCLAAERAGYWVHRQLRSDMLQFLSRSPLVHQRLLCGPLQPMRAEKYKNVCNRQPGARRGLALALLRYRLGTGLKSLQCESTRESEAPFQ